MSRRIALFCCSALICGCSFDTSGVNPNSDRGGAGPGPEATAVDAVGDAAARDRGIEAARPDSAQGQTDGAGDAGPSLRDAVDIADSRSPADGPLADVLTRAEVCAALFKASVPGYKFCNATANTCRFYFSSDGSERSCDALCGAGKGCSLAQDNEPGYQCKPEVVMACDGKPCTCASTISNGICTCYR